MDLTSRTHPIIFLGLVGAMVAAIWCLPLPGVKVAAFIPFGLHWLIYVPSSFKRTEVLFDATMAFSMLGTSTLLLVGPWVSKGLLRSAARHLLVYACITAWAIRLGYFLWSRIKKTRRDFRHDEIKHSAAFSFFAWSAQAFWCFMQGLPAWALGCRGRRSVTSDLGKLDLIGLILFVSGFFVEHIADQQRNTARTQLSQHLGGRSSSTSGRSGHAKSSPWVSEGLWAYSQHPNYVGEVMLWAGISTMCFTGLDSEEMPRLIVCLAAPVWSWFFLHATSVRLIARRQKRRFGHIEAFRQYAATTPLFLPCCLCLCRHHDGEREVFDQPVRRAYVSSRAHKLTEDLSAAKAKRIAKREKERRTLKKLAVRRRKRHKTPKRTR